MINELLRRIGKRGSVKSKQPYLFCVSLNRLSTLLQDPNYCMVRLTKCMLRATGLPQAPH
jgi:hypothetical protein